MLNIFHKLKGEFLIFPDEMQKKIAKIEAFVTDWDGVFNKGEKGENITSSFTEADSMGTNLLRYYLWKRNGKIPPSAIITGADNPTAKKWGEREHFHNVYSKIRNKKRAIDHFCEQENLDPKKIMYCFDDVNDLPIARIVGLRFMIRRNSSPLLAQFANKKKLADYITGHEGGNHAIREVCELFLGVSQAFDDIIEERVNYTQNYQDYFKEREKVNTVFLDRESLKSLQ